MLRQRHRTHAFEQPSLVNLPDGVGSVLRIPYGQQPRLLLSQSDGRQTVRRGVLRRNVVAEEQKARVQTAILRQQSASLLLVHRCRQMEAHHVVFAVQCQLNDTTRLLVHLRPTAHQQRASHTRREVHQRRALRQRHRTIAVVASVASMERRNNAIVDEHLLIDERSEVRKHRRHGQRLARCGRVLQNTLRRDAALAVNGHAVERLAEHLALARVCNGKHRGHSEQHGVATVRANRVFRVGITLLLVPLGRVNRGCITEHAPHRLKRVPAIVCTETVIDKHKKRY